ncbi:MAG: nucleoside kinase [Clostridia bacterium]|nr:nucleoside kinase [Clostridia bacterium]
MRIVCNDKAFEVAEGVALRDALQEVMPENAIAARYNNEIASLNQPMNHEGKVEFIDRTTRDGRNIYVRGLLYLVSMAAERAYPGSKFSVDYQLSNAMFCEFADMEITDEVVINIKTEMDRIVRSNLPIIKKIMTPEEAERFYKEEPTIRGRLQLNVNKDKVSLYYCEEYFNYFYGTMPISTGFAEIYDIAKYHDGLLIRYPSTSEPNNLPKHVESLKLASALKEYDDIYRILGINTVYKLNKRIREGKIKELILFSEALHEKKIAEIAQKIKERGNVRMVLIAGPSSSGKTTFAGKLGMSLRVNGIKPVTISVDNYFVERENNPKDESGNYDFECIEALDLDLLNDQLVKLLNGEEVELPTFDFKTGHKEYRGNKLKLEKDQIIVMEGIHCLNERLTSLIPPEDKFKVYISDLTVLNIDYYNRISTTDTRLIRRIVRDYNFRNYSALHTLNMWYSVNRGEQKYIFPYQEEADVMFNSSIVYEISALKKYAVPLLQEIPQSEPAYSEARRLLAMFQYFDDMEDDLIPNNSLIREFIGGSIFED